MFRIVPDTNIDFIGKRKAAFALSAILVILGIVALVMVFTGKANLGIDFAGGVMIQGHFDQPVAIEELRSALSSEFPDVQVTKVEDFEVPNAFIIKTKRPEDEAAGEARLNRITEIVETTFVGNTFTRVSSHVIGPAVGETLRRDAQWAVIISLLGILVYIAVRFDFRSGVAATIATFHDVLAVLGIMILLGKEFDLLLIVALLTLAGYSLSDTVVIFDRIRENFKKYRGKSQYVSAVNLSINETLARTINTSLTVLIVVAILFVFGGEVLRNFSLALILGVLIGTYSSVFIASPIVVEWEARSPRRFK
ncbi:MAG: protein translocase subunit SecF [candidate division Zixibacteria bacterium]|jgi:preprotein translocase subunit SecF|nr:protein translocase subunit SecF [candidate division Zixibacteria bacterium]